MPMCSSTLCKCNDDKYTVVSRSLPFLVSEARVLWQYKPTHRFLAQSQRLSMLRKIITRVFFRFFFRLERFFSFKSKVITV